LLGVTDIALIDEICDGFAAADGAAIFQAVDRVAEAGHDPRRFAGDLLERLRDLIVLNQVPDAASKGLLDVPSDELERMTAQALRLGTAELSRIADIVHDGLIQMRGTTAPRLVLELICARALLPGAEDSARAVVSRLERLERRLDIQSPAPASDRAPEQAVPERTVSERAAPERVIPERTDRPDSVTVRRNGAGPVAETARPPAASPRTAPTAPTATPSAPPPAAPPATSQPPQAGPPSSSPTSRTSQPHSEPAEANTALDAAAVRRAWPDILEHTKRRRVVWSMLQNVMPRAVQGDVLVLDLQHGGLLPRFSDDDVVSVIQDALDAVLGVRWKIRCEVIARGGPAHAAVPGSEPRTAGRSPGPATSQPTAAPPTHQGPTYEGFDPGDQPMDDDPVMSGPNVEEQAVAAVRRLFPETIHDQGPRAG